MYLLLTDPDNLDINRMLSSLLTLSHHYEDRLIDEKDPMYTPDTHMYISPIIKKIINQQKAIEA